MTTAGISPKIAWRKPRWGPRQFASNLRLKYVSTPFRHSKYMSDKSKRLSIIVLGILLGTFLSGIGCAVVWYQVELRFPSESGFGTGNLMAFTSGIVGLVSGAIGGAILGGIVTGYRLRMPVSLLIGLIVNGILPFLVFYGAGGSNAPHDVQRWVNYSSLGQAVVGGAAGLFISFFSSYMNRTPTADAE